MKLKIANLTKKFVNTILKEKYDKVYQTTKETNYYSNYIIIKAHENAKQTAVTTNGELQQIPHSNYNFPLIEFNFVVPLQTCRAQ